MAYSGEHYPAWSDALGPVSYPAFGENLTTFGLLESDAVIGAVYQVGTVLLQVTQPRRPCYKLSAFHGIDKRAGTWLWRSSDPDAPACTSAFWGRVGCEPETGCIFSHVRGTASPPLKCTESSTSTAPIAPAPDDCLSTRRTPCGLAGAAAPAAGGEHEEQAARLYGTTTATTPSVTTKESS